MRAYFLHKGWGVTVHPGKTTTTNLTKTMNNDFALLNQFLESLGPEVAGHSSNEPLTDEQSEMISRFAGGSLSEKDRESLLPSLLENENALRALVEAIRARQS